MTISPGASASQAAAVNPAYSIGVSRRGSANYPSSLLDLAHPPDQLFLIGRLDLLDRPIVAIVGTRAPSAYGLRIARALTTALSRAGVTIVSGMARGVDAVVHQSSLENEASTIAVLGTGVDVPYPSGHRHLHRSIAESGLIVSENASGLRAYKGAFPRRNRIIAALARATIVIEAGHKSGALNTAAHALDIGRPVAAVPGPIDSAESDGTNQLIRDGALVIASVADALALAGVASATQSEPIHLSETEARVWSALGAGCLRMDAIATVASLPTRECLAAVTSLELRGLVECLVSGEVRRR